MSSFLVLYFFQGEPGESIDTPNCFQLPKVNGNSKVTFGQFMDRFPVTAHRGQMHFRFKADDNACGYVWMDITDHQTTLPLNSAGIITCKILCLDHATSLRRYSRLKVKKNLDSGLEGMTDFLKSKESSSSFSIPKGIQSLQSKPKNDTNNGRPSKYADNDDPPRPSSQRNGQQKPINVGSSTKSNTSTSSSSAAVNNLFDDDDDDPFSSSTPTARSTVKPPPSSSKIQANNLAASNGSTKNNNGSSNSSSSSSNGQSTQQPSRPTPTKVAVEPSPPIPPPEPIMSREELAARREAQVEENVEHALREKQERDQRERVEAIELDDARSKFDKNLTTWQTVNKEKRNVRTLLTTMHTVLWAGNSWKPIGLGDVIEPKQVKLQYRKAMLIVHPDKVSKLSTETQFIAKRVFEGINEAYQEFLKKEEV